MSDPEVRARPAPAAASRKVAVSAKPDIDTRAVVQLGVRVSVEVDDHLAHIIRTTGRTKRELVEMAILSLQAPE